MAGDKVPLLLGLLFYFASMLVGVMLVNRFLSGLTKEVLVKYAAAFPIGFVVAAYTVLLLDMLAGSFSNALVLVASFLLLFASYVLFIKSKSREMFSKKLLLAQLKSEKPFYLLMFAVLMFLLALQFAGLSQGATGILGGDNYGQDFLFHVSIGNSVLYTSFPPSLLYTQGPNAYPFITDFFTAILWYNSIGTVGSVYLANIPLYFSLVLLSVFFMYIITNRRLASIVGLLLFLLSSLSVVVLLLYLTGASLPYLSNSAMLAYYPSFAQTLYFPIYNFVYTLANIFSLQTDYMLGFPYALVILSFVFLAFFRQDGSSKEPSARPSEFAFVGFLIGVMPLVNPYSLIFIFIFCAVAFFYSLYVHRKKAKYVILSCWFPLGAVSFIFGLPLLLYVLGARVSSNFFQSVLVTSMWSVNGAGPVEIMLLHMAFWFETIGPLLVLGLLGLYFFRKRLVIFLPAFIVLLIVNVTTVQASFADSNKIMLYFVLFMSVSASELLARIAEKSIGLKALALVIFFIVISGGLIYEYYEFALPPQLLASNTELQAMSWIANNTPQSAVFVDNCYNNVFGIVSSFGQRHVVLEDQEYAYEDGLYRENPYAIGQKEEAFLANPNCPFMRAYNASYVVLMNVFNFNKTWCVVPAYNSFFGSANFTEVQSFGLPDNNITIFKSKCV